MWGWDLHHGSAVGTGGGRRSWHACPHAGEQGGDRVNPLALPAGAVNLDLQLRWACASIWEALGKPRANASPASTLDRVSMRCPLDGPPERLGHSLLQTGTEAACISRCVWPPECDAACDNSLSFGAILSHHACQLLSRALLVARCCFRLEAFSLAWNRKIRSQSPESLKSGLPCLLRQLCGGVGGDGHARLSQLWSQPADRGANRETQGRGCAGSVCTVRGRRCLLENTQACSPGAPFPILAHLPCACACERACEYMGIRNGVYGLPS